MIAVQSFLAVLVKACLVIFLFTLVRGLVWVFNLFILAPFLDPLKNIPGPDGSALETHLGGLMDPDLSPKTHKLWTEKYGKTFRFHGFGSHDFRLMTFDLRSVSYILTSPVYEKPWQTRRMLTTLLGRGLSAMEGNDHKVLRKLIGPAFTAQAVRATIPICFQKAEELRDRLDALLSEDTSKIDITHWISRATFDVIGLAGFDYNFHALQDESEEVYLAYRRLFDVADQGPVGMRGLLQMYSPFIEKVLPDKLSRTVNDCLRVIRKAGIEVLESKRLAILAEKANASEIHDKDILSLLIKANLSADPSKRLSDSVLLDQIVTLIFAGNDTTSLFITWCIHLLSLHPAIQIRLREELLSLRANSSSHSDLPKASSSTPAGLYAHADAIEALPFLDSVIRETLRICSPVHSTIRTAMQNDIIPISSSTIRRDGTEIKPPDGIPIRKGTFVHIPLQGLNMSEDIWGKDAREFKPDRWSNLPESARAPLHPGIANVMSFSLGPHSCPGWRLSTLETKLFISVILPHFIFTPAEEIGSYVSIVMRPYVRTQLAKGSRLPIMVQRYFAE
ncbi:hypothetical protein PILCRDRAFT_818273 [Piloderma croceum F 1598]|uniref:Cytochrome P450 n=1 Tax=Piloderma croceum (strain F 1598) TaxID=765440 RepID=A0A0C3FKU6_PILCF|nr:hypothetical protein PILCRDRAFT_818273 [Piloderma croceum F 1598]